MALRHRTWIPLLALFQLCQPVDAAAVDWLTINPLELELLFGYRDFRHEEVFNYNRDTEWETGLRMEQSGYIEDPRLISFTYILEPKYYDGHYTRYSLARVMSEDTSRNFLSYAVGIDFFRESTLPVWGQLNASQSSTVLTGSLGNRTEADYSLASALLYWNFAPFPMQFEARQRTTKSISTRASGSPFLRDDLEHTIRIKGDSSKTRLLLEARLLDDRVPNRDNDFDYYSSRLNHHLPWGRASYLDSSAVYNKRDGKNSYDRFELSEFAYIHHTGALNSEINYRFGSTRQSVDSTRNFGRYRIRHRLYQNLTTSAQAGLEKRTYGATELDRRLAGLDLGYNKSNFFGTTVGLFLSAIFSNNTTESRFALLEVVDESYTVPVTELIILRNRFVLPSTIVVTDTSGAIVYAEGQDYLVEEAGDGLTQLSIIAGGLIETGDVILVSYKAAAVPPSEFDRLTTTTNFSLGFRGFSLTHNDSSTRYTILSGDVSTLADTRNTTTRAAYALSIRRASIQLGVERRYYRNGEFESTTRLANQSLGLPLTSKTRVNLSLHQAFTETNFENVDVYSANVDLTWRPKYNLTVRPVVGARMRISERFANEDDTGIAEIEDTRWFAQLTINWTFRKLSFDLTYSHNERTLEQFPASTRESTDDAVRAYLRRRF